MSWWPIIRSVEDRTRRFAARMIRRGTVALAHASLRLQLAGLDGERIEDAEFWQHFGLASRPPAGAEVLWVVIGGEGDHAIAIATNDRGHRPSDLENGDAALYASGDAEVRCKADGDVDLTAGPGKTVNVGGGDELLAKGETLASALSALADALTNPSLTFGAINTAAANFLTAVGGLGAPGIKATKGRVT